MLTVRINDELEQRLRGEARRRGVEATDYAAELLQHALPGSSDALGSRPNQKTLELLAEWDADDDAKGQEMPHSPVQEAEQFMQNLNRNRREMEGPNARSLGP